MEKTLDKVFLFGEEFPTGRLTSLGKSKPFNVKKISNLVKELGRPLTPEEFEKLTEKNNL